MQGEENSRRDEHERDSSKSWRFEEVQKCVILYYYCKNTQLQVDGPVFISLKQNYLQNVPKLLR